MGPRKRLRLTEMNPLLVCVICKGYLIDATAIVECLHSFCRSCIIKYLEGNSFCPICDVQIHKAKPYRNIKPDKALQCIVYKLVPGLYHAEMARRREFYSKYPDYAGSTNPEDRGMGLERMIYAPDDKISLSLEYYDASRDSDESDSLSASSHTSSSTEPKKRYLLCPALVTVGNLKKFLRFKYDLKPGQKVDVFHKRECLSDDLTLMDVAYIYTWKRNGPMEFLYRFSDVSRRPVVEDVTPEACKEILDLAIPSSNSVLPVDQEESLPVSHEVGSTETEESEEPPKQLQLPHVGDSAEGAMEKHSEASPEVVNEKSDESKSEGSTETKADSNSRFETERTTESLTKGDDILPPNVAEVTSKVSLADAVDIVKVPTPTNQEQVAQEPDSSVKSMEDPSCTKTKTVESAPAADRTVCLAVAKHSSEEESTCSAAQHNKSPCESSSDKDSANTTVIDTEKPSRISIGLLASLALERRSNSSLSITLAKKRTADDGGRKLDSEKRPRLSMKSIPNHSTGTSSLVVSKSSSINSQGQEKSKANMSSESNLGNSNTKDTISCVPVPGKLTITPVPTHKPAHDKTKNDESKCIGGMQVKPSQLPYIFENCERPKRPMSHMPILQTPPSPSKSLYDPLNSKMSSIPRLIEINSMGAAKPSAKKSRMTSKRVTKRGDSQKHDGFGALDLSGTSRRGQHTADILAIAQNLARRQQLLAQASAPTPPLSPLSSLSAFPVPNFAPVRSPPPPLRIPVPSATSSSYRHQHPHQQRPSSLSSSSPSPPAENGSTPSRSPRVGASPTDIFTNAGLQNHYLHPPSPSNPTLMFRSRFELQNPWHGEWYNDHLMRRCLESLRLREGLPSTPYFAYPTSASANGNKNTVPK